MEGAEASGSALRVRVRALALSRAPGRPRSSHTHTALHPAPFHRRSTHTRSATQEEQQQSKMAATSLSRAAGGCVRQGPEYCLLRYYYPFGGPRRGPHAEPLPPSPSLVPPPPPHPPRAGCAQQRVAPSPSRPAVGCVHRSVRVQAVAAPVAPPAPAVSSGSEKYGIFRLAYDVSNVSPGAGFGLQGLLLAVLHQKKTAWRESDRNN